MINLHFTLGPCNYARNDTIINHITPERFIDTIKIHPKMIEEAKEYLKILNISKESVYLENSELHKICKQLKQTSIDSFKERIREINKSFSLQNQTIKQKNLLLILLLIFTIQIRKEQNYSLVLLFSYFSHFFNR